MPSYRESQPGSRRSGERTGVSVLSTPKARPFSEGAQSAFAATSFPGRRLRFKAASVRSHSSR